MQMVKRCQSIVFSRGINHHHLSYSLQGLQHDDTISSDDHHANCVLVSSWSHLQTVIHHQVHKGIKASQNALHMPASIQLQRKLLVHEFFQLWRMCFTHLDSIYKFTARES